MKKVRLEIVGLSYSQTQSGAYALVLGESSGTRRLPIIIGGFEAQAIAIELEKMSPSRPLTHDLFKAFAQTFNITVNEVLIYNLVEGIFYAKLICTDGTREVYYELNGRGRSVRVRDEGAVNASPRDSRSTKVAAIATAATT